MTALIGYFNRFIYGSPALAARGDSPVMVGAVSSASFGPEDVQALGASAASAAAAVSQDYMGYRTTDITSRLAVYWYQKGEDALLPKEKYNAIAMIFNLATALLGLAVYQAVFGNCHTAFVWGAIALFARNEAQVALGALQRVQPIISAWFGSHVAWLALHR